MNTFVSNHYRGFDQQEIANYLSQKCGQLRQSGNNWVSKECPWCPEHGNKSDNLWKLAFTKDTGAFRCPRCGTSGSYFDFKRAMGDLSAGSYHGNANAPRIYNKPDAQVSNYPVGLQNYPDVMVYLCMDRKLTPEAVKHYRIGAAEYSYQHEDENWYPHQCVTFPWIEYDHKNNEQIVRIKARALDEKSFMRLDPAGGAWGWFGWHTVPNDAYEIVITEGEVDAVTVWQELKKAGAPMAVISLPNGCRSLPTELLPHLERFTKIIWWLDDDIPGQEGVYTFARKVGLHRSWFVETRRGKVDGPKDANDALIAGQSVYEIFKTARPVPHEQVLTWRDLKADVMRRLINPGALMGTPSRWLPTYNKIVKGFRYGELKIVTGKSGGGKTTILSQISLDFATSGIPTCWGSFEIKNAVLGEKMIKQFAQKDLSKAMGEYELWSSKFEELPLYWLKYFGSTDVDQVLEAARYCVYAYDVRHFIFDNLQFMSSGQGGFGVKKFELQDSAVDKFRKFANDDHTTVTLVIHPTKLTEGYAIDTSMLGGTGKAEQEADDIMVLQNVGGHKYLEWKKNRFDGELGRIYYDYNKDTQRIFELTPEEVSAIQSPNKSGEGTMQKKGYKGRKTGWSPS